MAEEANITLEEAFEAILDYHPGLPPATATGEISISLSLKQADFHSQFPMLKGKRLQLIRLLAPTSDEEVSTIRSGQLSLPGKRLAVSWNYDTISESLTMTVRPQTGPTPSVTETNKTRGSGASSALSLLLARTSIGFKSTTAAASAYIDVGVE